MSVRWCCETECWACDQPIHPHDEQVEGDTGLRYHTACAEQAGERQDEERFQ